MRKILLSALVVCFGLNKANAQLLDQSNTAFASSGWLVNSGAYQNMGQSFTAGVTGQLESISISIDNSNPVYPPAAGTFAIIIRDGSGSGGTIRANESFTIPAGVGYGDFNIPISTIVNLTAGNVYTFYIDEISGTGQILMNASNDVYSGGILYFNSTSAFPSYDLLFKTYMVAPPTYSSIDVSSCMSYTSPSGNYTWTQDGVYTDTISNSVGGDSIITISLSIDAMPYSTTFSNGYNTGYGVRVGNFVNELTGWGTYWDWDMATAFITKTTDGGLTYTSQSIPGNYIGGVYFVDLNTGYACGNNGSGNSIAKSTNGGATWITSTLPTAYINQLNTIKFLDALHGTAGGYGGALYVTTDGGNTWNYHLINSGNVVFNDIKYVDANTIWAVGFLYPGVEGNAYLSTDGGATWTLKYSSVTTPNFTAVDFINANHGFILGDNKVFETFDGGNTWAINFTGASGDGFYDINHNAGKIWLAGGNSGSPLLFNSTDAITWNPVSISPATTTSLSSISLPSANRIYLGGDRLIRGINTSLFDVSLTNSTICSGDTTILFATGATTYSWETGSSNDSIFVNPTSTTTFSVTGSSNSCSLSDSLTITVLQPSSSTDTHTECYSYLWIDGNIYTSSNTTATHVLTNSVGCDSTVTLNLTILNASSGTDTQAACSAFTWIDGNTYVVSTTTPTFTLTNAAGCDSVVTLNLTIDNIDLSVTNSSPTLTAVETGASYQWLNCGTGFSAIGGATSQAFTATANGTYAVVISSGACVDTTACEIVTGLGLNAFDLSSVSVYPNPSTGKFTLDVAGLEGEWSYRITSADGRVVTSTSLLNSSRIEIDLNNEATGIYVLSLMNGNANGNFRLIKE